MSDELNDYCKWSPDIATFGNLEYIFLKGGKIDRSLYNNRERDVKHLNSEGADKVAKAIKQRLLSLEKRFFE